MDTKKGVWCVTRLKSWLRLEGCGWGKGNGDGFGISDVTINEIICMKRRFCLDDFFEKA